MYCIELRAITVVSQSRRTGTSSCPGRKHIPYGTGRHAHRRQMGGERERNRKTKGPELINKRLIDAHVCAMVTVTGYVRVCVYECNKQEANGWG